MSEAVKAIRCAKAHATPFIYNRFPLSSLTRDKVEASCTPDGVGIVRLMGRHAGFIAAHAALASGDVDLGGSIQFFVFIMEQWQHTPARVMCVYVCVYVHSSAPARFI